MVGVIIQYYTYVNFKIIILIVGITNNIMFTNVTKSGCIPNIVETIFKYNSSLFNLLIVYGIIKFYCYYPCDYDVYIVVVIKIKMNSIYLYNLFLLSRNIMTFCFYQCLSLNLRYLFIIQFNQMDYQNNYIQYKFINIIIKKNHHYLYYNQNYIISISI